MRRHLDDAQLIGADGSAEPGGKLMTPAALRVGQQVADLGDRQRRHDETCPVLSEEPRAPLVVVIGLVERCD
jgi:hypothetical protein